MKKVPRDQRIWNTVAMICFIAIFFLAFYYVTTSYNIAELEGLGWFDLIMIGLAAQRLTRLVSNDKIFAFVRDWFLDEGPDGTQVKPEGGFRRLIAELIECVWCTSMWAALFSVVFYLVGPIGKLGVFLLAVSSIAMICYNGSLALSRIGSSSN